MVIKKKKLYSTSILQNETQSCNEMYIPFFSRQISPTITMLNERVRRSIHDEHKGAKMPT